MHMDDSQAHFQGSSHFFQKDNHGRAVGSRTTQSEERHFTTRPDAVSSSSKPGSPASKKKNNVKMATLSTNTKMRPSPDGSGQRIYLGNKKADLKILKEYLNFHLVHYASEKDGIPLDFSAALLEDLVYNPTWTGEFRDCRNLLDSNFMASGFMDSFSARPLSPQGGSKNHHRKTTNRGAVLQDLVHSVRPTASALSFSTPSFSPVAESGLTLNGAYDISSLREGFHRSLIYYEKDSLKRYLNIRWPRALIIAVYNFQACILQNQLKPKAWVSTPLEQLSRRKMTFTNWSKNRDVKSFYQLFHDILSSVPDTYEFFWLDTKVCGFTPTKKMTTSTEGLPWIQFIFQTFRAQNFARLRRTAFFTPEGRGSLADVVFNVLQAIYVLQKSSLFKLSETLEEFGTTSNPPEPAVYHVDVLLSTQNRFTKTPVLTINHQGSASSIAPFGLRIKACDKSTTHLTSGDLGNPSSEVKLTEKHWRLVQGGGKVLITVIPEATSPAKRFGAEIRCITWKALDEVIDFTKIQKSSVIFAETMGDGLGIYFRYAQPIRVKASPGHGIVLKNVTKRKRLFTKEERIDNLDAWLFLNSEDGGEGFGNLYYFRGGSLSADGKTVQHVECWDDVIASFAVEQVELADVCSPAFLQSQSEPLVKRPRSRRGPRSVASSSTLQDGDSVISFKTAPTMSATDKLRQRLPPSKSKGNKNKGSGFVFESRSQISGAKGQLDHRTRRCVVLTPSEALKKGSPDESVRSAMPKSTIVRHILDLNGVLRDQNESTEAFNQRFNTKDLLFYDANGSYLINIRWPQRLVMAVYNLHACISQNSIVRDDWATVKIKELKAHEYSFDAFGNTVTTTIYDLLSAIFASVSPNTTLYWLDSKVVGFARRRAPLVVGTVPWIQHCFDLFRKAEFTKYEDFSFLQQAQGLVETVDVIFNVLQCVSLLITRGASESLMEFGTTSNPPMPEVFYVDIALRSDDDFASNCVVQLRYQGTVESIAPWGLRLSYTNGNQLLLPSEKLDTTCSIAQEVVIIDKYWRQVPPGRVTVTWVPEPSSAGIRFGGNLVKTFVYKMRDEPIDFNDAENFSGNVIFAESPADTRGMQMAFPDPIAVIAQKGFGIVVKNVTLNKKVVIKQDRIDDLNSWLYQNAPETKKGRGWGNLRYLKGGELNTGARGGVLNAMTCDICSSLFAVEQVRL